jgi:dynein intermediate chain 2
MLSSIAVQNSSQTQIGGKMVAVGDANGVVTLLELCDSLSIPQPGEKKQIDAMFDREIKQEKNLEARERDIRRQRSQSQANTLPGMKADVSAKSHILAGMKDIPDDKIDAILRKVISCNNKFIVLD